MEQKFIAYKNSPIFLDYFNFPLQKPSVTKKHLLDITQKKGRLNTENCYMHVTKLAVLFFGF